MLEGGYNTEAGPLSPFAQSVTYHVRALQTQSCYVISDQKASIKGKGKEGADGFVQSFEKIKRQILKKRRNEFRYYDNMNLRKRRRVE
mmetsp:Transcript_16966/g.12136  ORF Transcript_16966/g.12136 Transcript_16966/m.12136 type:complete len:88 (+) Transcript_16966:2402-2665(+)